MKDRCGSNEVQEGLGWDKLKTCSFSCHFHANILGCHDSGLNCEYPAPICDLADHTCKCNNDDDCKAEDFCNTDTGKCEPLPTCVEDVECEGFDEICNANYDNCFYCGGDDCQAIDGCCPGKI